MSTNQLKKRLVFVLSDVVRPSFEANRSKIAGGCARRTIFVYGIVYTITITLGLG